MPYSNYQTLHVVIQAARRGREILLRYLGRLAQVEEKLAAGLVSEADRESELEIKKFLKGHFPEIDFLGEEEAYLGGQVDYKAKSRARWIVDPLDGTTNYIHQFNVFCISIGLEVDGEIVLAVVDVPMMNETYTAIKGKGAWVNGRPLKISSATEISQALLATGFVNDDQQILETQLQIMNRIVRKARGIRRPGAAAYDLCLVARGVFDGFWEKGIRPWDTAGGLLLVQEAGGVVLNYQGQPYRVEDNNIIAANPILAKKLFEEISVVLKS